MQLQIISIARKVPQWVEIACAEYVKRLPHNLAVQWTILPPAKRQTKKASIDRLKQQEAEQIRQKIQPYHYNLALHEKAKQWTSQEWSRQLEYWMQQYPVVNFIIGGADGLSDDMLQTAHQTISLGLMTMPHALVQVILIEQLYRAWSIYQGHPYHRN